MSWQRPNIGSRMNREVHVRFWERAEVKFLRATRHGMDDAEGLEEREHDVHHQEKECGRREERQDDRPEPPPRPRAVDGGGLDQRFWDYLQARKKEQKIIAELVPDRRDDDEKKRLPAIEHVIPVIAVVVEEIGEDADARVEHEAPQHAG